MGGVSKKLVHLLEEELVDVTSLQDAMEDFHSRLKTLNAYQEEVEREVSVEEDIESVADFREKARCHRTPASKVLKVISEQASVSQNAGATAPCSMVIPHYGPRFGTGLLSW